MIQRVILAAGLGAGLAVAGVSPAAAKTETKAMLSKSCSVDRVKQLSEGAAVRVAPGAAANIVTVTLDTTKMSWLDLTKKMHAAGCFN